MGFQLAVKAHGAGNLGLAATHYKRALAQKQFKPELFQNYGALLRATGDLDESKKMYLQGLELFPGHLGICRNYANLLREREEMAEALLFALKALRIAWCAEDDSLEAVYCESIDLLLLLDKMHWALAIARQAIAELGVKSKLLWALFRINRHEGNSAFQGSQSRLVLEIIEDRLNECSALERAEFSFVRSFYCAKLGETSEALHAVKEAHAVLENCVFADAKERDQAQKLMDVNSWNASCVLLKAPDFQMGWHLFEYGLRAPAQGRQRWQRHLKKVFTHHELPLWRGCDLGGLRLLLLEEQAIGDTMMFLTLISTLVEEAAHVGVVLSERLLPIYKRSLANWVDAGRVSIWSHDDVSTGRLAPSAYDYQSPVGSVCQYRFNRIECFSPQSPVLIADQNKSDRYRSDQKGTAKSPLRIGISWRGGGRSDRIKLKSMDSKLFSTLFTGYSEEICFVNLQYGDVESVVGEWRKQGFPVEHQPTVNPLKNMEEWLNLVASCDAVVSVANTTIHGSGGLNIPTICLLSVNSDWRWLNSSGVERSYWYPSVGIARQTKEEGWLPALQQVRQWIDNGCPMPDGPVHTDLCRDEGEHAFVVTDAAGA